jgi:hypothetical protein
MRSLFFVIVIFFSNISNICYGQYSNPENAMLSDSISSFFYYSTNPNGGFSNPGSLRDTERRAQISDNYHEESEKMAENARLQKIREKYGQNPYYQNPSYYQPYGINQYNNYNQIIIIRR